MYATDTHKKGQSKSTSYTKCAKGKFPFAMSKEREAPKCCVTHLLLTGALNDTHTQAAREPGQTDLNPSSTLSHN